MEKKVIVFLEEGRGIGGAENVLITLLKHLDRERFEPWLVISCGGRFFDRLKELGLNLKIDILTTAPFMSTSLELFNLRIPNPLAIVYNLMLVGVKTIKISRYLKKKKINLLQTNDIYAHIYGGLAAKINKIPCVWTVQDICSKHFLFGMGRMFLNFFGAILPERIIAISQAVKNTFSNFICNKIDIVPLAVDTKDFTSLSPEDSQKLRESFNIDKDDIVVGMTSRLVPWKGHKVFLKAISLLVPDYPKAKFIIVGDTTFGQKSYCRELKKIAKDLGVNQKVIFTGFTYKVKDMLSIMDILVHSSVRPEPFGLDIIEAMALGKVVVASSIGGPREIIENGQDGVLVQPASEVDLAKELRRLFDAPERRDELSRKAEVKIQGKYTVDKFMKGLEKIYLIEAEKGSKK